MQDPAHPQTIDVFIGVDVGKGKHYAVALGRAGRRLSDRALPSGEAQLKALIEELRSHGALLFVVDQPASIGALPRLPSYHKLPGSACERRIGSDTQC